MSNIKGRKFKDNSSGKMYTVVSVFDNIAILDNKTKIAVEKLLGPQFSPVQFSPINESNNSSNNNYLNDRVIDADAFLNRNAGPGWVNNISKQVGNINTNNLSDNIDTSPMVNMDSRAGAPALRPGEKNQPFKPQPQQQRQQQQRQDESPAVTEAEDPEMAKQALLRKYSKQTNQANPAEAARRQMESLMQFMDEEDIAAMTPTPVLDIPVNDPGVEVNQEKPQVRVIEPEQVMEELENKVEVKIVNKQERITETKSPKQTQNQEDPIITLFNNAKRNYELKLNLPLDQMIPNPSFIALMEDSYNKSMIEYLADEFAAKIVSDPELIKNLIKEEIEKIVYNKDGK